MTAPTFVAKRFLRAANGDAVNADYIVRLFRSSGKLMAKMTDGTDIELHTSAPVSGPPPVAFAVEFVGVG